MISINPYPVFDDQVNKLRVEKSDYCFEYNVKNSIYQLKINEDISDTSHFYLDDERAAWNMDENNLIIKSQLQIFNSEDLFIGSNKVSDVTAKLGIALIWGSKASNYRNSEKLISFDYEQVKNDIILPVSFELNIPARLLKDELTLKLCLYLHETKKKSDIFCNKVGTILGVLIDDHIYLDGDGSEFPIVIVHDKNGPLWFVYYNCSDIYDEMFNTDSLAVCLNEEHRNFKHLNFTKGLERSPLFSDVLAAAFQEIITSVSRQYPIEELRDIRYEELKRGSIASALKYLISIMDVDLSSPCATGKSIRSYFSRRF